MKKMFYQSSLNLVARVAMLATLVFLLSFTHVLAQCSVVGTGTVTGNVNYGSSNNWANPNRSTLSDDLHSRVQLQAGEVSKYLSVSDYGWVIPIGATITGIEVKIEGHQEDFLADFADNSIRLMQAGVAVGTDHAGTGYYDDKDYVNTYGSASDLWGAAWTPADIMDPGFGVLYSVTRLSGSGTYYMFVDYVELTVYYTGSGCILPVTYRAYDVTLEANKTTHIQWVTSGETNASHFEIERSVDGTSFSAVGTTPATGATDAETSYQFIDPSPAIGTNFYRLAQYDLDGDVAYSEIKSIHNAGDGQLQVMTFPNPATQVLQISGSFENANVQLIDLSGRPMLSAKLDQSFGSLDVSNLARGIYVLQVMADNRSASQKIVLR